MTDKLDALAQRIVAAGIGYRIDMPEPHSGTVWGVFNQDYAFLTAESFCNDGRVVLALMEKVCTNPDSDLNTVLISGYADMGSFEASVASGATPVYGTYLDRQSESIAIAIVEACLEALEHE